MSDDFSLKFADGVELGSMKLSANEIRECFENICEAKFGVPSFEVEGDYVTMTLESARRFSVEYAASSNTTSGSLLIDACFRT